MQASFVYSTQLVAYQRAQDNLLAAAAQDALLDGQLRLIKNCRDSQDNVYGAQENYDALAGAGIKAVLNFAPVQLDLDPRARVKNVDLLIFLEELAYFLQ